MHFFITGGAGFIGSNLADRLLALGHRVTAYDNFSSGQKRFIEAASASGNFRLIEGDLLDTANLNAAVASADFVFHLAANADVRFGTDRPRRDLEQNTITTSNVLEAMRQNGIRRIAFSSTGSVYGEPDVFPTPENAPFPVQTSFYGASKLAGEGLISAYVAGYGFQGYIFRFASILGERYTHGHVFDFYKKLRSNPAQLDILGDGHQRKTYLYVQDCIDAILLATEKATAPLNIFNLGFDGWSEVNDSVGWICEHLRLSPHLAYNGGTRGWIGDSPFIYLDTARIRALGWTPKLNIREGIIRTLTWLQGNTWVLDDRS